MNLKYFFQTFLFACFGCFVFFFNNYSQSMCNVDYISRYIRIYFVIIYVIMIERYAFMHVLSTYLKSPVMSSYHSFKHTVFLPFKWFNPLIRLRIFSQTLLGRYSLYTLTFFQCTRIRTELQLSSSFFSLIILFILMWRKCHFKSENTHGSKNYEKRRHYILKSTQEHCYIWKRSYIFKAIHH